MLLHDISSITRALKHGLREDGQIRILEKEAQAFISNLNSWARRAKVLERWPCAGLCRRKRKLMTPLGESENCSESARASRRR